MLFSCPLCAEFSTYQLRILMQHISLLHAKSAGFTITCGLYGCIETYQSCSGFRSHVYRKHRDLMFNAVEQISFCPECSTTIRCNQRDICSHLKCHIEKYGFINCPFESCSATYTVFKSFTSHVSRVHAFCGLHALKANWSACTNTDNGTGADIDVDSSIPDVVSRDDESYYKFFKSDLVKSFAAFFIKIQEHYLLPSSVVQEIFSEVCDLQTLCGDFYRNKVKEVAEHWNIDINLINTLSESISNDVIDNVRDKLGSDWKREKYYSDNLNIVVPETIFLGTRKSNGKKRTCQYVPLLKNLENLLKHTDIQNFVVSRLPSWDGNLHDYFDGSYYKTNAIFCTDEPRLQIICYFDEFEVVNPIGHSKTTHKLGGFYYSLGNIPPSNRSQLHVIQLAILVSVSDIKEFGLETVLKPFIHDLKILETEGLFVPSMGRHIRGTVTGVVADNLGSHFIGGFRESFNGSASSRPCRFCMISKAMLEISTDPDSCDKRTIQSYKRQTALVAKFPDLCNTYGLKHNSVFNKLQYFHVSHGLPPDIMHDFLEGIIPYELPLIISSFLQKKLFTLDELNSTLNQWKYGPLDARNKPISFPKDIHKKDKVIMNAGRMWCLIRMLPLMLYDKVNFDDEHWQLLLLLKDIAEIIFAPVISIEYAALLDVLIREHHCLLRSLHPEFKLKPKHHFMLHYGDLIIAFGPLIHFWCMRFEAKHSYFKRLVRSTKNFINLPITLAKRHQQMQASYHLNDDFLSADVFVATSRLFQPSFLAITADDAFSTAGINSACLRETNHVIFKGMDYYVGMAVALSHKDGVLVFGKIETIVFVRPGDVPKFLVSHYHSDLFTPTRSLKLTPTNTISVCCATTLCDYYPLTIYKLGSSSIVALKHIILKTN